MAISFSQVIFFLILILPPCYHLPGSICCGEFLFFGYVFPDLNFSLLFFFSFIKLLVLILSPDYNLPGFHFFFLISCFLLFVYRFSCFFSSSSFSPCLILKFIFFMILLLCLILKFIFFLKWRSGAEGQQLSSISIFLSSLL